MRRPGVYILLLLICALSLFSLGATGRSQTSTPTRLITVTARTVDNVTTGRTYVADISRDTVMYEFDPTAGQIDLSRVAVRTATEQKLIEPWVESAFANRLDGWQTEILTIGTVTAFRNATDPFPRPPGDSPPSTDIIVCDGNYCMCSGQGDCYDLIHSGLCNVLVGCTRRGGGPVRCLCDRR